MLGNTVINFGRPFTFGQLARSQEILALEFERDSVGPNIPAILCRKGAMDSGCPMAAIIQALRGDDRDAETLLAEARSLHPDASVRKLSSSEIEIRAVNAAISSVSGAQNVA